MGSSETIFVQIASYRDPQLAPTIADCVKKATYPERLRFGICWQRDETEQINSFVNDQRFRILAYHWRQSRGVCWARNKTQSLYNGEKYTLQIDSHSRFAPNWDEQLIEMLVSLTDNKKPLLTAYPAPLDPAHDTHLTNTPHKIMASYFNPDGSIFFHPEQISRTASKPIRSCFVAGGFFFTLGQHCRECQYDPHLYFSQEEANITVRSFTAGYDIFHPHINVIWHEYSRADKPKHWQDHNQKEKNWSEYDTIAKHRVSQLLGREEAGIDLGPFGLGAERSLTEYERWAGVDFKNKRIQNHTVLGCEPPAPFYSDEDWEAGFAKEHAVSAVWEAGATEAADDYAFWFFGIEDKDGKLLHRDDITGDHLNEYVKNGLNQVTVKFLSSSIPYKWILWPVSKSRGWLKKIEGTI